MYMVWHICPSIISTPLYLHNLFIIPTISRFYWLNSIFRLYLGVNTIWYLHNHFVCDKLLCLFAIIKIILSLFLSLNYSYFIKKGWFFNCLTFISHQHSGCFFRRLRLLNLLKPSNKKYQFFLSYCFMNCYVVAFYLTVWVRQTGI